MKDIFDRLAAAWRGASDNNVGILAAGIAYYAFLALVPLLASAVLGYGLFTGPETVARHIAALAGMLPAAAADLIGDQLAAVVATSSGQKGLGLLLALALALVGARNGAASIITGVSIAYDSTARRSFVRGNLVALAITLGALVGAGVVAGILAVTAALESWAPEMYGAAALLGKIASYAVLLGAGVAAAATLYRRVVPDITPGWREVLPGALLAGIGWVLFTLGFGIYVANFGNYNATYGSLGAVVVLLTWLYLVAYVLLLGAELNAVQPERAKIAPQPASA
jgi:membrane protein